MLGRRCDSRTHRFIDSIEGSIARWSQAEQTFRTIGGFRAGRRKVEERREAERGRTATEERSCRKCVCVSVCVICV